VTKFIYETFVLSFPEREKSVDIQVYLSPYVKVPIEVSDFFTLLYFYEYLTKESVEALVKFADSQEKREKWKGARLAIRLKDVKRYITEIAAIVGLFYFREDIADYLSKIKDAKLTTTAKVHISANWFFVDEMEDIIELESMDCLIKICLG
jgi:hypothetical protein